MHEDERAPLYLLKLHQELDELGKYPRSVVPAFILLTLGVVYTGTGLLGLIRHRDPGSLLWLILGGGVISVGFLLARHSYHWYRRARSMKRGIHLIESRQANVLPPQGRGAESRVSELE